jgi:hypothetical protein
MVLYYSVVPAVQNYQRYLFIGHTPDSLRSTAIRPKHPPGAADSAIVIGELLLVPVSLAS